MFWPRILRILYSTFVLTQFVTASTEIKDVAKVLYGVLNLTAPLWNDTEQTDAVDAFTAPSIKSSPLLSISQLSTNSSVIVTGSFGTVIGIPGTSEPFLPSTSAKSSESGGGADTTSITPSSPNQGLGAIVLSAFNNLASTSAPTTTPSSYSTQSSFVSLSNHYSTSPDITSFISVITHPTFVTSRSGDDPLAINATTSDVSAVLQPTSTLGIVSSSVTEENIVPISLGPYAAIYGTLTYSFQSDKAPITIKTNGQTISIGPNGIGFAATTIAIPNAPPPTANNTSRPFNSNASTTPPLSFSPPPTISITILPPLSSTSSTITTTSYLTITTPYPGDLNATTTLPSKSASNQVTIDGLTISVGTALADISGTTYAIDKGAPVVTVTVGGKILSVGPSGVGLPNTTVTPLGVPTQSAKNGAEGMRTRDWRLVLGSMVFGGLGTFLIA